MSFSPIFPLVPSLLVPFLPCHFTCAVITMRPYGTWWSPKPSLASTSLCAETSWCAGEGPCKILLYNDPTNAEIMPPLPGIRGSHANNRTFWKECKVMFYTPYYLTLAIERPLRWPDSSTEQSAQTAVHALCQGRPCQWIPQLATAQKGQMSPTQLQKQP